MIVELVILAVAVIVAALIRAAMTFPRLLQARTSRRVLVTLKSGTTFGGVLTQADSHVLVLKGSELVGDGAVPVDGELVVMRGDVDYMQVP